MIGVTYGGNGQTTFGLPNLSQRAPLSFGQSPGNSNYTIGQQSGFASETLTLQELPIHNHTLFSGTLDVANPDQLVAAPTANALFGRSGPNLAYDTAAATPNVAFAPQALAASTGTSQPHENRQPFLQTNFCICLNGLYPSRP